MLLSVRKCVRQLDFQYTWRRSSFEFQAAGSRVLACVRSCAQASVGELLQAGLLAIELSCGHIQLDSGQATGNSFCYSQAHSCEHPTQHACTCLNELNRARSLQFSPCLNCLLPYQIHTCRFLSYIWMPAHDAEACVFVLCGIRV